jgi:ribose transport system substrate-binding protein
MRRYTTLVLGALLCLPLPAMAQTAKKPWRITYIQGVTGNPFYISVGCGSAAEAKTLGVDVNVQGPQLYQPQLQTSVLDAVIAAHPDGIMISEDDPVAMTPTLLQAKAAGIKIIMIDGDTLNMSVPISNIQSDDVKGGGLAADALATSIHGKGQVMALMNSPAALVARERLDGFRDEITKYPGIKYLGVQYSNNDTSRAAQAVSSTAAAHPGLVGVFAITTNNTEGAATGVREAEEVGKIKIVGFDTSDPIVQDVRKGLVAGDVVQAPYQIGEIGVQTMVDALDGKKVPREIRTPFVVATPANIDTPGVKKYIYVTSCAR